MSARMLEIGGIAAGLLLVAFGIGATRPEHQCA
jgi:hypothetical protein